MNKKRTIARWSRLLMTYSSEKIPWNFHTSLRSHLKNSCFRFHQAFQTPRNNKSTRPKRPRAFICFSVFGTPDKTLALVVDILHKSLRIGHYKNGLFLTEVTCTLLKERLKNGQNCTENEPLRTPDRLISRTQLKKRLLKLKLWYIAYVHITTFCTNSKQYRPTFILSLPCSLRQKLSVSSMYSMAVLVKSRIFKKLFISYCFKIEKMSNEFEGSWLQRTIQPPARDIWQPDVLG